MTRNTQGLTLHCSECSSIILKKVALAEGSRFIMRCPKCQANIKIIVTFNYIEKKCLTNNYIDNIIEEESTD